MVRLAVTEVKQQLVMNAALVADEKQSMANQLHLG